MFKKTLLITSLLLTTISGSAFATPKNGQIEACGLDVATLRFKVYDIGWYYVASPDDSAASGWYFVTPITEKKVSIKNTHPHSFATIIDRETNTTLTVECGTSWYWCNT